MGAPWRTSALYVGKTTHTRRKPAFNRFTYNLFLAMVDLRELESGSLDCWPFFSSRTPYSLTSLLPRDHMDHGAVSASLTSRPAPPTTSTPASQGAASESSRSSTAVEPPTPARPVRMECGMCSLEARVRCLVQLHSAHGMAPDGPVRLLTGLRILGMEFNPVSFYFVLDKKERRVEALIAEVNNIPWFEQHLYVLSPEPSRDPAEGLDDVANEENDSDSSPMDSVSAGTAELVRFSSHPKAFHVSPFMPIKDIRYDWLVGYPGENLRVRIELREREESFFMASLDVNRRPFSALQILRLLVTYPLMTAMVVLGIMYEAAKLWFHGAFTFYSHPSEVETAASKAVATIVSGFVALQERCQRKKSG